MKTRGDAAQAATRHALGALLVTGAAAGAAPAEVEAAPSPGAPAISTTVANLTRPHERAAFDGPADYFTGRVRVEMLLTAHAPARASGASVTFQPGARTAWHTHPLGQTLIVTAGVGLVQFQDGPIREMRVGDVVWIPPSVKHWHGASPGAAMTHIAIAEEVAGSPVTWLEQVSDAQYAGPAQALP
ncbi:cupin [Roseateles aquatilis]|uniref:Cupin n=2 Tax=Roseateles aquatilis TaxID=431061 RepID=A0A246IZK2_9BURK|nr:cupin [Roseateles aquatilis]